MEFLNVGATTTDLCLTCGDVVPATVAERPVELEVSGVVVPDVLVTVCDTCGSTLSIPAQAEWQLQEARVAAAERKLTARVTRPQLDALHVIADALGAPEALLRARLFSYYLNLVRRDQAFAATLVRCARSPLPAALRGPAPPARAGGGAQGGDGGRPPHAE